MKSPITALRLRARHRGFLERISDATGCSMAEVVMHLLDGAIAHPERWPAKRTNGPPHRGERYRQAHGKGRAGGIGRGLMPSDVGQ